MATSECMTTPATAGERLSHFAGTAIDRLAGFWRSARNRRSVAKLLDWDDRMLRDIGLTSTDVRSVLALPAGQDPSTRLGVLSIERRAAIRAEARERLTLAARVRSKGNRIRSKSETRAKVARPPIDYPFLDL